MGYCVEMELEDVKFPLSKAEEVKEVLRKLNIKWHNMSDWCRYDGTLTDITDIFEDIGFEAYETAVYVCIVEFEREKLGDHQNMFEKLAPFLEDCSITFSGEDGETWKVVVKDHKVEEFRGEIEMITIYFIGASF